MQRNDYERLRHPRQTGDASGSMDAEYVEVTDYSTSLPRPSVSVISTTVSMATEDESGYTLPKQPTRGICRHYRLQFSLKLTTSIVLKQSTLCFIHLQHMEKFIYRKDCSNVMMF